jgi:hypothetical protein
MASSGLSASAAGLEIRCAEPHVPPAGRTAARIETVSPSASRQTATTLPAPSDATRGADADAPAGEMSNALSSPPAA